MSHSRPCLNKTEGNVGRYREPPTGFCSDAHAWEQARKTSKLVSILFFHGAGHSCWRWQASESCHPFTHQYDAGVFTLCSCALFFFSKCVLTLKKNFEKKNPFFLYESSLALPQPENWRQFGGGLRWFKIQWYSEHALRNTGEVPQFTGLFHGYEVGLCHLIPIPSLFSFALKMDNITKVSPLSHPDTLQCSPLPWGWTRSPYHLTQTPSDVLIPSASSWKDQSASLTGCLKTFTKKHQAVSDSLQAPFRCWANLLQASLVLGLVQRLTGVVLRP